MTARTPKVGEVWTDDFEARYVCLVDAPDRDGDCVWDCGGTYTFRSADLLTPPVTPVPGFMPSEVWLTAYRDGPNAVGAVRYVRDDATGMVTR